MPITSRKPPKATARISKKKATTIFRNTIMVDDFNETKIVKYLELCKRKSIFVL